MKRYPEMKPRDSSDCSRMSGHDPSVISGYTAGSERAPTIDEGREFGRKGSTNHRDREILRTRKGAGRKMTGRGFNSRARRNNQPPPTARRGRRTGTAPVTDAHNNQLYADRSLKFDLLSGFQLREALDLPARVLD